MAKISEGTEQDLKQSIIEKIQIDFKKEEVTLIFDKYFASGMFLSSWEVGEKEGCVRGNSVLDGKRLSIISWIVKAIGKAEDMMVYVSKTYNRDLGDLEKMNMLDKAYEAVCDEIATNWLPLKSRKSKY